jgi:beta-fructofuranosidase
VLRLPDAWAWDFWLADNGHEYHLFFLRASRALRDPDRRHHRAAVGHAVSTDLRTWTLLPDALAAGDAPAFDDLATWTGSVPLAPDGVWHMYYTGVSGTGDAAVQRIGLATSEDLVRWEKQRDFPLVTADSRWYERLGDTSWPGETWRDPWVFADPGGDGWHMLITARAQHGPVDDRGVIGHARSCDLVHWEAQPPLSSPGAGFGQLEVPQVEEVDGRAVLLFSCLRGQLSAAHRRNAGTGGVWAAASDRLLGPYDVARARPLTDDSLYSGRLVKDRNGDWVLLAFHNQGPHGFVGAVSDPIPVRWSTDGRLETVRRGAEAEHR